VEVASMSSSSDESFEDIKPLSRIDSLASYGTAVSEATYNLEPFKLVIPKSPVHGDNQLPSYNQLPSRVIAEEMPTLMPMLESSDVSSDDSYDQLPSRGIVEETMSEYYSSEDSFATHARSIDLSSTPLSSRRLERAVSPPPGPSITFQSHSPIWKKLEMEKKRQKKLRARLHGSAAF
jgi:hypothetical protein